MRALTGLGVAVFVGCLLGGIGYALAVLEGSGEPVATVEHPAREGTFAAPLDLDPTMNPLRAGFEARYSQTLGGATLTATVALRTPDGTTAWTRRLRVSMPIERFDVPAAGRYEMDIRLDDALGAHFITAEVTVRRNVRALDWTLLGGLAAAGVLGIGLALGANALQDLRPNPTR